MSPTDDPDDLRVRAQRVRERASELEAELDLADSLMALVLAAYDEAEHMERRATRINAGTVELRARDVAQ
jgi:hypothetical protein